MWKHIYPADDCKRSVRAADNEYLSVHWWLEAQLRVHTSLTVLHQDDICLLACCALVCCVTVQQILIPYSISPDPSGQHLQNTFQNNEAVRPRREETEEQDKHSTFPQPLTVWSVLCGLTVHPNTRTADHTQSPNENGNTEVLSVTAC